MTVGVHQNGRRSVGALLRDLAEGGVGLVRSEVRLARVETVEALSAYSSTRSQPISHAASSPNVAYA